MINLALNQKELEEIIGALTDNGRYASPSLVAYLKGKEKWARTEEKRSRSDAVAEGRRKL